MPLDRLVSEGCDEGLARTNLMSDDKKLTPREAAHRARVSTSLIYSWCSEGRLAHYRLGATGRRGRILIDPADLDAVIEECRRDRHPLLASGA